MSKRISRRRLQVLQAQGQDLTQSSGPAMSGSIGTFERTSDLSLYTSEITLDLGNATYPASSYSTAAYKSGDGNIIGYSASASGVQSGGNAQLILGTTSQIGVLTSVELVCVEQPTAGATSVGLYYSENLSSSNDNTTQGTAAIAFAAQDVGTTGIVDLDIDADGFYWYLASTGSTSAIYTAGKFVLRFYGYQIPDDIT
tara:strand:+ start:99 stop:695 length:597 start_codon:yes stop_codon:yes gene_type:complete